MNIEQFENEWRNMGQLDYFKDIFNWKIVSEDSY